MEAAGLSKTPLTSNEVATEDLQAIFDHIDDHLAFWEVLFNDSVSSQDESAPIPPIALTPVSVASDWLKMSSAPLYSSRDAGGMRGIIYRALNLPLRIFGLPLIRFNRKLRDFLGELFIVLQKFDGQTTHLNATVERLEEKIQALELENEDYRQEIETLSWRVRELQVDLDRIAGRFDDEPPN